VRLALGCPEHGVVSVRMTVEYGCKAWRCQACNILLAHHDKEWKYLPKHIRDEAEKEWSDELSLKKEDGRPVAAVLNEPKMRHAGPGVSGG